MKTEVTRDNWPIFCQHANEVPTVCPCPTGCGCRTWGPDWCHLSGAGVLSVERLIDRFVSLKAVLREAACYLDCEIRPLLPNEHSHCDHSCQHRKWEADSFDNLDRMIESIDQALRET